MKKLADIAAMATTSGRGMGKFTKVTLAPAYLMSSAVEAQEAKVTQLLSKDLTNPPGEEGLMITRLPYRQELDTGR